MFTVIGDASQGLYFVVLCTTVGSTRRGFSSSKINKLCYLNVWRWGTVNPHQYREYVVRQHMVPKAHCGGNLDNRQKLWLKHSCWIETKISFFLIYFFWSRRNPSKDKDTGSALLCCGANSVVITRANWQGRSLKSQAVLTVLIKASIGRKKAPDSYSLSWWTGKSESRWHRRGFALLFHLFQLCERRVLTVLDAN